MDARVLSRCCYQVHTCLLLMSCLLGQTYGVQSNQAKTKVIQYAIPPTSFLKRMTRLALMQLKGNTKCQLKEHSPPLTPQCTSVFWLSSWPFNQLQWQVCMQYLRWQVNNFTIHYINCLISLVVQSLTAKPDIQILHGKYYLSNKS